MIPSGKQYFRGKLEVFGGLPSVNYGVVRVELWGRLSEWKRGFLKGTVDGRNPTPVDMVNIIESYPIICKVLYIPGGCLGFLNHQQYHSQKMC